MPRRMRQLSGTTRGRRPVLPRPTPDQERSRPEGPKTSEEGHPQSTEQRISGKSQPDNMRQPSHAEERKPITRNNNRCGTKLLLDAD